MHFCWIGTVEIHSIACWYSFSKVGLVLLANIVSFMGLGPTLKESTPSSIKPCSFSWYHLQAAGLVKSMKAIPACCLYVSLDVKS